MPPTPGGQPGGALCTPRDTGPRKSELAGLTAQASEHKKVKMGSTAKYTWDALCEYKETSFFRWGFQSLSLAAEHCGSP